MSKHLVPIQLPENIDNPAAPSPSFVKLFLKNGWLTGLDAFGLSYDLVLKRPLDNFTTDVADIVTSGDTVLGALEKFQSTFNNLVLVGDVSGVGSYNSTTGKFEIQTIGGAGDTAYNGNRFIKRSPYTGINVGGATVKEFLDNFFFPFIAATVSLNSFGLQEKGTTYTPTITGTITLNDETIVSSREIVDVNTSTVVGTPAGNSINQAVPSITADNSYQIRFTADNNGNPGVISSAVRTVSFVYPFFYGMSSDAGIYTSGGTAGLYTAGLTKLIQSLGSKTVLLNGTGKYAYFAYPASYGTLSQILDQNGFDVTSSFQTTVINALSSGLTPGWGGAGVTYRVYRTILTTTINNANFQFKF